MQPYLEKTFLQPAGLHKATQIYELAGGKFANRYFIISNEGTRHLLASPEVIGYESYLAMCGATGDMLGWLKQNGTVGSNADIMTILRGGLNYPLEECCYRNGINVNNMDFISCERVIRNNQITGLDIRYTKLTAPKDITLMIGDIIASGETLARCIRYIIAEFKRLGGSIRRMVFFTIGGTRGIELFEELTNEFRFHWPEFEGITCIFYEGIFSAYKDKGVTGKTCTITFTITPLQAFSNGTYYVPKHTVEMTDGVTLKTHEFTTSTTGSSSYPGYRQGSSGASSFIVNSAVFTYNENVKRNHPKSGYCTLQVLEYDEDTAGNFDYVSYVTVEFNAT